MPTFTPDEYPALKALGKVVLSKPVPPKVKIAIDRDEEVSVENKTQYIATLNAEIATYQTAIDARQLLITDITNA
jgi:hypothetical protein